MDEWISKKDLLAETRISYGQLYRWKREGLIPENWFVKRAVPSGQETYLPREMILNRISFILKYKDKHPLSELHQMLSPDSESRHYKTTALIRLPGMLRPIMQISALTNARDFNHGQALCALIGANILTACDMTDEQLRFIMKSILEWQQEKHIFSSSDGRIAILRSQKHMIPIYVQPDADIMVAEGTDLIFELRIDDIQKMHNKQLNKLFEDLT
ncbi:MAG: DUF4004 family protein [Clostridia bacterium]|nr:DUF4004 family protein [Clostridia bacterium]